MQFIKPIVKINGLNRYSLEEIGFILSVKLGMMGLGHYYKSKTIGGFLCVYFRTSGLSCG